nr:hypothetical protein [Nocardia bovistercoris]
MTAVVVGPLLGSGYLLLRDAVSTPRSYLTDAALGLGDAAPRAVPQDAFLAALSPVVDGGLLVKAILVVALWAAGYGAALLARELLHVSVGPQLVACTVAVWNPFVAERLAQGHWSLLTGYAALPWTALAARRLRAARSWRAAVGGWGAMAAGLAAAGLTPTGALLAGCVALVTVGRRHLPLALLAAVAASAPWLAATFLSGAGAEPSDPAGVAAFAARAETGLGTLGSLAGLGGIWNGDAVPDSRTTPLAVLGTALLLILVAFGIRTVTSAGDRDETGIRRALLALAVVAVAAPALAATAWGVPVMEWLIVHVPGAGLLRDTQKYVALAMPAYALCAAAGSRTITRHLHAAAPDDSLVPAGPNAALVDSTDHHATVEDSRDAVSSSPTSTVPTTNTAPTGAHAPATTSSTADTQHESPDERTNLDRAGSAASRHAAASPTPSPSADDHRDAEFASATTNPATTPTSAGLGSTARESSSTARVLVPLLAIAFLILPLFDLAGGVGGAMRPVHYPIGWQRVAERIDGPGDVAVLPGGMFRKFPYSGKVAVLDPAPRMLPNDVLQTGRLPVRGMTVEGEGARATEVENTLLGGGSARRLAELEVGWVLVERSTPGPIGESARTLVGLESVYEDPHFALYRVSDPKVTPPRDAYRTIAILAHLLWVTMLVGGLLAAASRPTT